MTMPRSSPRIEKVNAILRNRPLSKFHVPVDDIAWKQTPQKVELVQ